MAAILSKRNRSILAPKNVTVHPPCNCRRKAKSPLNGECRKKVIIYKFYLMTTTLPNTTVAVVNWNLNLTFTTMACLSRANKKEIQQSYQKPFGKPSIMEKIHVLNGPSEFTKKKPKMSSSLKKRFSL